MKVYYQGKEIQLQSPTRVRDIIGEVERKEIACICNNEIRSLDYQIKEDTYIKLIDISHSDGMRIYIRGLCYIMAMAFSSLYPDALLTVNYQLSNSMYYVVENKEVTEEMIQKVHEKMQEIIDLDLPIQKVVLSKEEAKDFYEKYHTLKGIAQLDNKTKKTVTLYYCKEYFDYYYGIMPISTGYMKIYDILPYKEGFLVRYPSTKDITCLQEFKNGDKLLAALDDYEKIHKLLDVNTLYKLNREIKRGEAKNVVLLEEALHEKRISRIADEIANKKDVKMVLIAGPSSSGKTTFAQRLGLQLQLNGLRPRTISVDNYFVERKDNPIDENGEYDFESIDAIDLELFNDNILRLLRGEEVKLPTFNFTTGSKEYKGNTMKLDEEDILVIEGIHCLNDKLTSQIPKNRKYKIYISALTVLNIDYHNRISTTDSRLLRRMVRDHQFRGYSAYHTLKMWPSVNRGEKKNIFPYQEEADVMFNTSLVYEIAVLKDYALPLLKDIKKEEPEYAEARRLIEFLTYFESIPEEVVPSHSLLREFIGGGDFKY